MPDCPAKDIISSPEREKFIKNLACFATLSAAECDELAKLMTEKFFASGDVVVTENALVDSVYILVQGQAEVSRIYSSPKKSKFRKTKSETNKVPFAILNPGETIGLNDTGFFSTTGKRTATVMALSDVVALHLDLQKLHAFLQEHPALQKSMLASSEHMLRIRLIKQSLPFSRLSHERLLWLANQVQAVHVAQGQIIFREGDPGDRCYLIQSGQVEIIAKNEEGNEHQLAVLSEPTLFGEATLITHAPRNATARAVVDCHLLELKHAYLSELIETENNVATTFMNLMVDRSRPIQNPTILLHERTTADGQLVVILKNPENGNYFKLSEEGLFIWQQMTGEQTMQEITLALADEYKVFAPDIVAALISKLAKAGFISNVDIENAATAANQPAWIKFMTNARRILESRIAIGDADTWITKLYRNGAYLLFSKVGKLILACLIVLGFVAFSLSTHHVIELFREIHDSWLLVVYLLPVTLVSVALHELGHALATKSYGNEVHYMGVGWYWFGPVAFTDTSDMWLSTRMPRIFVNLAGVYTDMLVGGVASLLIFLMPSVHLQAFLWLFAVFTYISAFRMLNPLQELDGYYVLMDLFDRPRLRQSAVVWLVKEFPRTLRHPSLIRGHVPEISYWVACILFLIGVSVLTLLVQAFVFKILGFKPSNPMISLALPIFAGVASSLGIIADVRNQAEE